MKATTVTPKDMRPEDGANFNASIEKHDGAWKAAWWRSLPVGGTLFEEKPATGVFGPEAAALAWIRRQANALGFKEILWPQDHKA